MNFLNGRRARAQARSGDHARDAGDWLAARQAYAEALKLDPSRAALWVQLGHAAKECGDLAEAEAAYRTALTIDPQFSDARLHLAHALKAQSHWRESEQQFARLVAADPTSESLRRELEFVHAQLEDARRRAGRPDPAAIDGVLQSMAARTNPDGLNQTHFGRRFANYEIAMLNVKNMGYLLARALGASRNSRVVTHPTDLPLASKLCTQSDIESDWMAFWARELKAEVRYHRKLWEFCYIAHALWQADKLRPGSRGVGFGCGSEPLGGLFARFGTEVLVTDLAEDHAEAVRWHAMTRDPAAVRRHYAEVCPQTELLDNIRFQAVDMNHIPPELDGRFDFCWSACALEHLGSIDQGLAFIENSLRTLKPGGVAVHTTEFNLDDDETLDDWGTVLFQRKHFTELSERLAQRGYRMAPLDFNPGDGFLDGFVDIPPWSHDAHVMPLRESEAHLKLALDGFICTSFGLSIVAPPK